MKLYKQQDGIAHPGIILLILLVLSAIGFAGWRVHETGKDAKEAESTATNNSSATTPASQQNENKIPNGYELYENAELGFKFAYPKEWGEAKFNEDNCNIPDACEGWQAGVSFDTSGDNGNAVYITSYSDDGYVNKDGSRMVVKGYKLEEQKVYSNYDENIIEDAVIKNSKKGEYVFLDAKDETEIRQATSPIMFAGINLTRNPRYKGLQVHSGNWKVQQDKFTEFMDTFQVLE